MPKRKYALDTIGKQRLVVSWQGGLYYRQGEISVYLDGNLIGSIPAQVDLKQGAEFVLPDASILSVKLEGNELRVFRNGKNLALIERERQNLLLGRLMLTTIGIVDLVGGIVMILGIVKSDNHISMKVLLMICGILFLGLALWERRRSKTAFIMGMMLYVIQMILLIILRNARETFDLWVIILGMVTIVDLCVIWIRAVRSTSHVELVK